MAFADDRAADVDERDWLCAAPSRSADGHNAVLIIGYLLHRDLVARLKFVVLVAEYDRLGQHRFLEKYGFGTDRSSRMVVAGKNYDSKAIVGEANGLLP